MHNDFMKLAIELALQAKEKGDHPFGAVIVQNGKVIATGASEELSRRDVTKHAELIAVSKASNNLKNKDLGNCEIYASGEPCIMCASAIFQARINKVYIGAIRDDLPNFFRKREIGITELAKDASYTPQLFTEILNKEARALFDGVAK